MKGHYAGLDFDIYLLRWAVLLRDLNKIMFDPTGVTNANDKIYINLVNSSISTS